MDKYDKFAQDIEKLGYITTPYETIYDHMPDATSFDIVEGLRCILVNNHYETKRVADETAEMQRLMANAISLEAPVVQPRKEMIAEPVDNAHTYPQNSQAQQVIESIQYFSSLEEFYNNTKNLSQEGIALVKLHLLKLIITLKKEIRTKVAIDPLCDTDVERLQLLTYKSYLEELTIEQEILVEEERKEQGDVRRIILVPNGKNSPWILEDIQRYPESYDEIYSAFENIMSKKFLGSKSISSIKDTREKLFEYKRTNGIRVMFIKRGNDIYICSLFYKDKQRSTKITAQYEEAISRFQTFLSEGIDPNSPDFEIQQKELIGQVYGEIEPGISYTLAKDGE